MFGQAHQIQPLPIRQAMVGPMLILCLFLLAGLVWQVIGGTVMRSAPHPAPRTSPLL